MTHQPPITSPEERDILPPGTVARWLAADHPGVYDRVPAEYRQYLPVAFDLYRVRDGWVADNEPLMLLTGDDLLPLPWRLVSRPRAQAAIDEENN